MLQVQGLTVEVGGKTVVQDASFVVAARDKIAIPADVSINGTAFTTYAADGVIVATPTGSTAYALSSNGPILQPTVPGFALVPICPHTLSNRPIAISERSRIEITLKAAVDALLHFDGQPQVELQEGDKVIVRRADHAIRFIHPPGYSYFAMLREKLHWSEMY